MNHSRISSAWGFIEELVYAVCTVQSLLQTDLLGKKAYLLMIRNFCLMTPPNLLGYKLPWATTSVNVFYNFWLILVWPPDITYHTSPLIPFSIASFVQFYNRSVHTMILSFQIAKWAPVPYCLAGQPIFLLFKSSADIAEPSFQLSVSCELGLNNNLRSKPPAYYFLYRY